MVYIISYRDRHDRKEHPLFVMDVYVPIGDYHVRIRHNYVIDGMVRFLTQCGKKIDKNRLIDDFRSLEGIYFDMYRKHDRDPVGMGKLLSSTIRETTARYGLELSVIPYCGPKERHLLGNI